MMKPVYIKSACAISPQHSFEPSQFLKPPVTTETGKFFVTDPDYRAFINPVAIRRMSRLLKMGIATGMQALKLAGVEKPDAIITGTGLGSMTDMERFLKDMINLKEEALNPTYFIQSTYNSVNGWIALQSKSTCYNQTFVNRGFSLELSLLDAQLLLSETDEKQTALVGCFDELTEEYFIVKEKVGYWKQEIPDSTELLAHSDTPGTIAGEGTAFFTVSSERENAICTLQGLKMIPHAKSADLLSILKNFLAQSQLSLSDIDLVITGMNGDAGCAALYNAVLPQLTPDTTITAFKQLTGEYPTSSGFALWLATQLFHKATPSEIVVKKGNEKSPRHILVFNHYILDTVSFILLSRA